MEYIRIEDIFKNEYLISLNIVKGLVGINEGKFGKKLVISIKNKWKNFF